MKINSFLQPFTLILGMLTILSMFSGALIAAAAVPNAVGVVIDDFEDGDSSDWGFFSGNLAGGGGGVLGDRPYEGSYYLSTGWGGQGSVSVFYGGAFRNFDNADQITPPADPWFNVWVLNQSDATVDSYTLEITIREDLDGDGWTDGVDDSFRLDTTFPASSFDDEWKLVSAPLSGFTDLSTGGDGTFNGDLDEIVIVISGVAGADPSIVEVDFDQFAFSSSGPLAFDEVVFDDMEHGDPFGNGWFAFNGSVGGGGINSNTSDLPPADGGTYSLETGWGSGGNSGFYGGFGRTNPVDISGTDYFNFWINPDGGQDYTLEVNLQEDDNSDGAINPPDDDEFQYNCVVAADGACAVAGGGWQLVSIPLGDFFDDNSYLTGGNGVLDPTAESRGGNGELVNVVIAVIGNDSNVNFRTDYWAFTRGPLVPDFQRVIDDFESGVAPGTPCAPNEPPLNFCTFSGASSSIEISNPATPPAPELPALGAPNSVLQMNVDVTSYAGFIHGFEAGDEWVSQDWSTSEGFSLWFHGTGSGTTVFIDILDNRNPGSTTDDAERWTVDFVDDFVGWQQLEFPFTSFTRKEIGNGAPNDGLTLFEVHGWALGTLGTGGPRIYYIDEVSLYGVAEPPALAVSFALIDTPIEEGTTGDVVVKLNRPIGVEDPAQVSVDYTTDIASAIAGEEYTPTSGKLIFTSGGPKELTFPIETFDDTKFEGDERIVLLLSNPVDVELGSPQARVLIVDNDPFDPQLLDDFEQGAFLWETQDLVDIDALRLESGHPLARPGQDAFENVLAAVVPLHVDIEVQGRICNEGNGVIPVVLPTTDSFDATTVDHNTVMLGDAYETHLNKKTGEPVRHVEDADGDGDMDLVFHFRFEETGLPCDPGLVPFNGYTFDGQPITGGGSDAGFSRDFAIGEDWSSTEGLSFWYYGAGGGEEIKLILKDNRASDPDQSGWSMVWSDEFNDAEGTPPDPANWTHEIGDGALNGIEGWGNSELQYYTDDTANASHDGLGNLVITLQEADGSLTCYYGPCEYTSARLLSWYKAEFAYGRIESRLLVPDSGDGLWPAFWSLGTDINRNPWPAAGEIDFMEYVSRQPNEIFGTIHGPGYSGGNSFGGTYEFGEPVYNNYHTFTIEWEPGLITWYVDGIQYHQADPADVPEPWVFDKPFFLLLNFAIGGNFGGPVDPENIYPQEYKIDYVRVFQGPDTAERFEASFTDDTIGWREVTIPITDFTRSADQPDGAPDDGLNLNEVWGYGFALPEEGMSSGMLWLDMVRREGEPEVSGVIIDDFESGVPATWFQYGDYGTGTSVIPTTLEVADRPGGVPSTSVLSVEYVSTGWGAGTGRDLVPPQDWSAYDGLSFWFNGSGSGTTFELILSDNKSDPSADTAERFHTTFTDDFAGWQHINLPWDVFYRGVWQPPGAPDDGLTLTEMWAYAISLPSGTSGTFYIDDVALYKLDIVDDFESGVPATWFQYGDYGTGTSVTPTTLEVTDRPGGVLSTSVLSVEYVSTGWGAGTGRDLVPPQDWSAYDGLSFWFNGSGSGTTFELILSDNKSDPSADTAERFHTTFTDDFAEWQYISLPWDVFYRGVWQPPGAPDDGLTLTEMWAYAIALPSGTSGTFYMDDLALMK